jgi:hypothetical protein
VSVADSWARRPTAPGPLFAVLLGLVVLAAMSLGGHATPGVIALGELVAFGVVLLLGGRSDTIRGLRGDGRDERFELNRLKAASVAGRVVILAVVIAWAREDSPLPGSRRHQCCLCLVTGCGGGSRSEKTSTQSASVPVTASTLGGSPLRRPAGSSSG